MTPTINILYHIRSVLRITRRDASERFVVELPSVRCAFAITTRSSVDQFVTDDAGRCVFGPCKRLCAEHNAGITDVRACRNARREKVERKSGAGYARVRTNNHGREEPSGRSVRGCILPPDEIIVIQKVPRRRLCPVIVYMSYGYRYALQFRITLHRRDPHFHPFGAQFVRRLVESSIHPLGRTVACKRAVAGRRVPLYRLDLHDLQCSLAPLRIPNHLNG